MVNWLPGASLEILRHRADLLAKLRAFFAEKEILEVETPALASAPVTDLHIQSLSTEILENNSLKTFYLQTSPEFAMKRLLACNATSIYQIAKVFRHDPLSKQHNPEFTLLEWYRPGFTMNQLMDEVSELLCSLFTCTSVPAFSYQELFEKHLEINPHRVEADELLAITRSQLDLSDAELSETDCLQLLMSAVIEPALPEFCFVYDYPIAQASLSAIEINSDNEEVAKRFEVYCRGMELANGYLELIDGEEQRKRFEADNALREEQGREVYPLDEKFLAALESGLPACSGVALGIDRLLMALHKLADIDQAISFTLGRA
jgi:elongation factor P--(R)-beta-lysine ligase